MIFFNQKKPLSSNDIKDKEKPLGSPTAYKESNHDVQREIQLSWNIFKKISA